MTEWPEALVERPPDTPLGGVLSMMLSRQFQLVDGRAAPVGRHYTECRFCQGSDMERLQGEKTSLWLVQHHDVCLLKKHWPEIITHIKGSA